MIQTLNQSKIPKIREQARASPFLKWAGGKGKLLEAYKPLLPRSFKAYFEPFLGGAALFFAIGPYSAILTDINSDLINCYQVVRSQPHELLKLLEDYQRSHSPELFFQTRLQLDGSPIQKAARFIYLNKTCYCGLYRVNQRGQFNTSIGRYDNPDICNPEKILRASAALQRVWIECCSFEKVLDRASPGDFIYFDPPYVPVVPSFKYSKDGFRLVDQARLQWCFDTLSRRGVLCALANSDTSEVRSLYQNFNIHSVLAPRAINSNGAKRGKVPEVLVTNY